MMSGKSQRLTVALGVLAVCVLVGLTMYETSVSAQAVDHPAAAQEIIAHLNEWRLAAGVPPLKPNETLQAMAFRQAYYLSTLSEIPSGNAMHLGPSGENVRERALYPEFNWPSYAGNAAVAEVGYVGRPESALEFWRGSSLHYETITNAVVREVGAAAVPHVWGHVYIVVFGSRPNVLPALVDPRSNQLYLTQDTWKFGPGNIPPMQVMLFDSAGRALNNGAWMDWSPTIPLPPDSTGSVYVLYNDGSSLSMAEVDLTRDLVLLPEFMPVATPTAGP
jgi:uncharacterized protein YkwD